VYKRVGVSPGLAGPLRLRAPKGRRSVKTTMIYTHILNRGGRGVESPVDTLCPAAAYTAGSCRVSHLSRTGGTLATKDLMVFSSRHRVVLTDMSPCV